MLTPNLVSFRKGSKTHLFPFPLFQKMTSLFWVAAVGLAVCLVLFRPSAPPVAIRVRAPECLEMSALTHELLDDFRWSLWAGVYSESPYMSRDAFHLLYLVQVVL